MKVVIIEDESLAVDYLDSLLVKTGYEIEILAKLNSVKNAIKWFINHPEPELIFMDIDLGDGLCFEIFEIVKITCPIIFTTAYDEYAVKAFKVNSIDYLLKPVDKKELMQSLEKYTRLGGSPVKSSEVDKVTKALLPAFKSRFIIIVGNHLKSLPSYDIMYFESRDKATYANTGDGRAFLIDYSLENLEDIMDPMMFFRINRKYIIQFRSIIDILRYSNSRLKVKLKGSKDQDIIVSRNRVGAFKEWLDR